MTHVASDVHRQSDTRFKEKFTFEQNFTEEVDMSEEKTVTLYLSGWQKRMIKDHMPSTMSIGEKKKLKKDLIESPIPIEKIYKIKLKGRIPKQEWRMYIPVNPALAQKGTWALYLTDEQINLVKEELNIKADISALNISPAMLESGTIAFE
jgi:hypothetical protein